MTCYSIQRGRDKFVILFSTRNNFSFQIPTKCSDWNIKQKRIRNSFPNKDFSPDWTNLPQNFFPLNCCVGGKNCGRLLLNNRREYSSNLWRGCRVTEVSFRLLSFQSINRFFEYFWVDKSSYEHVSWKLWLNHSINTEFEKAKFQVWRKAFRRQNAFPDNFPLWMFMSTFGWSWVNTRTNREI